MRAPMRLSELWKQLKPAEKAALAEAVDSDVAYLGQLASRWRGKKASVDLIAKLCKADPRLHVNDLVTEFSEDMPGAAEQAQQQPQGT
jgi:hypothetical protein